MLGGPAGRVAVALLDGEEIGAVGSARHAARLAADGHTPLVINIDGAGELYEAVAVEAGGAAHPILAALDAAGRGTGVRLGPGRSPRTTGSTPLPDSPRSGSVPGCPATTPKTTPPDTCQPETLSAMARLVVGRSHRTGDRRVHEH